jgi:nuclear pore complex protein Nup155
MLQAGLEVDKDALTVIHDAWVFLYHDDFRDVDGSFGRIQLAAMGVTLGSQGDLKQGDLASAVSHILTAAGGFPSLSENPSGRTITYSARHDGLVLTIARLLRPIWSANVTAMAVGGRQMLNIPTVRLQAIQAVLQKLRSFLEQYVHPF